MSYLSNLTMGDRNLTTSDMETLIMSNNTQEMVLRATFWIEGVLTPLVSIGGLAGMFKFDYRCSITHCIPTVFSFEILKYKPYKGCPSNNKKTVSNLYFSYKCCSPSFFPIPPLY